MNFFSRIQIFFFILLLPGLILPQKGNLSLQKLAPSSQLAAQITWGKGVDSQRTSEFLKQVTNRQDWLLLSKDIPADSKLKDIVLEHLDLLRIVVPGAVAQIIKEEESPAAKRVLKALKEYLAYIHPKRTELVDDVLLFQFLEQLLDNVFNNLSFRLGPSRTIPGFLEQTEAVEPGFSLSGLERDHFLVETVRQEIVGEPGFLSKYSNILNVDKKQLGFLKRNFYILKGKQTFENIASWAITYVKDKEGNMYTLLPLVSSSINYTWEPRGFKKIVFVQGIEIGEYPSVIDGAHGKQFMTYMVHKKGAPVPRVISFDQSGAGLLNKKRVYWKRGRKEVTPYPRIVIRENKVFLYREVKEEELVPNVLAYRELETEQLRVVPYRSTLFHSKGILDLQLKSHQSTGIFHSRFLHGALETALQGMSYLGASNELEERQIIQKTHLVAEAFDEVLEEVMGERLERIERVHRSYYHLSQEADKKHPLYGKRKEIDFETLPETVEVLLETYGNNSGLGFTVEEFWRYMLASEKDGGKFWIDRNQRQKLYSELDRILEQLWTHKEGHVGRIKVKGHFYYFSYTGFPFQRIVQALGLNSGFYQTYRKGVYGLKNEEKLHAQYHKAMKPLSRFFYLLEELRLEGVAESGLISVNAKSSLRDLKLLLKETADPFLRRLYGQILSKRVEVYLQMPFYEKYHPLIIEYLDLLSFLNHSKELKQMIAASIPKKMFPDYFFLLTNSLNKERRKEALVRILKSFEAPFPKGILPDWRLRSFYLLIKAVSEPQLAFLVLKQARELAKTHSSIVVDAFESNFPRIQTWENNADTEMDMAFFELYSALNLSYIPGIRFLLELTHDSGLFVETVLFKLGEIFKRENFDRYHFKDMVGYSIIRKEAIKTIALKVFSLNPERSKVALEALSKMDAPHEVLMPIFEDYRFFAHEVGNIPEGFLKFFFSQINKQVSQQIDSLKPDTFQFDTGWNEVDMIELQKRSALLIEKYLEKNKFIVLDELVDEVVESFSLRLTQDPLKYFDVREAVLKEFIKRALFYKNKGIRKRIDLQDINELNDFIEIALDQAKGVHSVPRFVNSLEEMIYCSFKHNSLYLSQKVRELKKGSIFFHTYDDFLYAYSFDFTQLPEKLRSRVKVLFSKVLFLDERLNALTYLAKQLYLATDSNRNLPLAQMLLEVFESALEYKELRKDLFRILSAYYYTHQNLFTDRYQVHYPKEEETSLELFSLINSNLSIKEKEKIIFEIEGLIKKDTALLEKENVVGQLRQSLKDPIVSPLVLKLLVRLIDYGTYGIKEKKRGRSLKGAIQALFQGKQGKKSLIELIERGYKRDFDLISAIQQEVNIFIDLKLVDLVELIKEFKIPFYRLEKILKQILKPHNDDLSLSLDLIGQFPSGKLNSNYKEFISSWYFPQFSVYDILQHCLQKLLEPNHHSYSTLADFIFDLMPDEKKSVQAAYQLQGEVLMSAHGTEQGWKIFGNIQTSLKKAKELNLPQKKYLQMNLFHELMHILFWIQLGPGWGESFEQSFLKEYPQYRGVWKEGKELFQEEFGYSDVELVEEWVMKLLEFEVSGEKSRLTGVLNKSLEKVLFQIQSPFHLFLDKREYRGLKKFLLDPKALSLKSRLLTLVKELKKQGLEIVFSSKYEGLESHCTPVGIGVEFSI